MATLTETAQLTKRILAGLVFFIISIIIFKVVLGHYHSSQKKSSSSPEPQATLAFGKLPALKIPIPETPRKTSTFAIETLDGLIPKTPKTGTVYFIPPRPSFTFFTTERAYDFAKKFGFTGEPIILSGEEYQWTDPKLSGLTLKTNIYTNNFKLKYNFATDSAILSDIALMEKEKAEDFAQNFLKTRNLLHSDLDRSLITSRYLKFDGRQILPVSSWTEANLIEVNFFRQPVEELPLLTESFSKGLISFLISGAKEEKKKILELNYTYWPIDLENFATYPLKSGEEAYEELKKGGGTVVSGRNQTQGIIREIYLAYLETEEHQNFLQPILVFEGDNDFIAYVSTIKEEWTE
jgi:hypothetical protein